MKDLYKNICFSLLFFLGIANAYASDKIGVVDQQIAMDKSLCGKIYQKLMQKELNNRQEKLTVKKEEFKKKYESLQRDKDILSKKELANKQKELELMQQALQKMHENFELEVGNKDQEESRKIQDLFTQAINNIGKNNKYNMIMPSAVVFYSGDNVVDITGEVTTELDKIYRAQNK